MTTTPSALPAGSLIAAGVRAYFAPVDRANALPVPFDPASMGAFAQNSPPPQWLSAGSVSGFMRTPAAGVQAVLSGAPAMVKTQARSTLEETLAFVFPAWTRLGMALSAGVQTLNLLVPAAGANPSPSGAMAAAAEVVQAGSTAGVLQLTSGTAVQGGDLVVVDLDYTGQTGYLGSGAPGTFVATAPALVDADLIRRVSFNVARVQSVSGGVATLASPLPAGAPAAGMKLSRFTGFVDCASGAFLPEWSGLFVFDGVQGDRMLLHYPRLQPAGDALPEVSSALVPGYERLRPRVQMRALPAADPRDGAPAVCYRSYLPVPMRLV